jgi:hypothetical protein
MAGVGVALSVELCTDADYMDKLSHGPASAAAGLKGNFALAARLDGRRVGFFLFLHCEPVWEVHTQLEVTGRPALGLCRLAVRTFFERTGADLLTTYSEPENGKAGVMAAAVGFEPANRLTSGRQYWALERGRVCP